MPCISTIIKISKFGIQSISKTRSFVQIYDVTPSLKAGWPPVSMFNIGSNCAEKICSH